MINPMDLTGKSIVVTGGSSGIGRQCAIQASRLGAQVSLIARNDLALEETLALLDSPNKHRYYCFDLNDISALGGLVDSIVRNSGPCDGLCHAAGIGDGRLVRQSKPEYVKRMFTLHVYAFIELVRCLSLKENLNRGASLVGISSVAAERGNTSQGVYGAAKAAMNGFVKPAALEFAKRSIRINTVAFAMVDTPLYRNWLAETGGDDKLFNQQSLGVIDLECAANAVMFMLSDASKYITGVTLPVYAGY